jgi:predicted aspartyl protease
MKSGIAFLSGEALSKLLGSVDLRGRPVVRIAHMQGEDEFLAIVDTGFNGQLLVSESDLLQFGPGTTRVSATVEVAGGLVQEVERAYYQIMWMGKSRLVDVIISIDTRRLSAGDEPIALIGTGLLKPHLLLIDFDAGTVEIEGQG